MPLVMIISKDGEIVYINYFSQGNLTNSDNTQNHKECPQNKRLIHRSNCKQTP